MSNVAAGSFIPPLPVYLPPDAEDGDDRHLEATLLLPTALVAATRLLARPALDAASDEAEAAGADNETLDGGCPEQSHLTKRSSRSGRG